ncbi:SDR family NAD(P)-dependent oxidoreductase [Paenibacillus lutrae]|uniref:SDR family NAD(P)-dependent oxidoreductase n=1 Tax=Paenibacillus lutrae TaxID=2078573 RepID=A0A7X3FEV6_9BACL|nr:SDR family oxidoreductase [Paenibacillus lutrae]MVO98414.1 SDR family NAD(P)-dependent oxidoreductase [Paenibacillus lutrae]
MTNHFLKTAIVTGGASGIGRALCKQLSARNIYVIVSDINVAQGEELVQEMVNLGGQARFVRLDVTDASQFQSVVQKVSEEFGRLDYLFNNAGISMYGEFSDMSLEDWSKIVDINFWGVIYGTHAAYPLMQKQGFGHIINTASVAGLGPTPMVTAYSATKHAVVGFTTSLHYEAEKYGVQVTTLCPGHVDTAIYDNGYAINLNKDQINKSVKERKMMSPEKFAVLAMKNIDKNVPLFCPLPLRKTTDLFFNLFPSVHRKLMRMVCRVIRDAQVHT